MADASIGSLPQAASIGNTDKFLLEQQGEAKYILGALLTDFINRNVTDVTVTTLSYDSSCTVTYDPNTGALNLGIPRGKEGTAAILSDSEVVYQIADSGSSVPTGDWSDTPPTPQSGKYLWTKTTLNFNTGYPVTYYSVARSGIDGNGAVSTVCGISPDANGDVDLTSSDVGAVPTTRTVNGMSLSNNIVTRLSFTNKTVEVADWEEEDPPTTGFEDFPYKAQITCEGVTASMFAEVVLYPADALSGIYAPVANTGYDGTSGYVEIWASEVPSDDLVIPTIYVIK